MTAPTMSASNAMAVAVDQAWRAHLKAVAAELDALCLAAKSDAEDAAEIADWSEAGWHNGHADAYARASVKVLEALK